MTAQGPPFFIVGSARSGTTLLRMILNAHPEIAVPPETRFVTELWRGELDVDAQEQLAALASHKRFSEWRIPIEAVRAELGTSGRVPYADVMGAAYRAYAAARGKSRWGDKTPRYVGHISLLATLWPDARIIHLVRDGRDVALSYADVSFGPNNVVEAAELWAERVRAGMRQGSILDASRYREIKYEELVAHTHEVVKALCDFLELGFDPGMLEYSRHSRDAVLARAKQFNPLVTETPRRTRSWQQSMSDEQIELFEAVAGDVLSELGYPRRFASPRSKTRWLVAAARLGAPVGRLRPSRS